MNISAELLRQQAAEILISWQMPQDYIDTVVEVMIDTDLRGIDSHGVGMFSGYQMMRGVGRIIMDGKITIARDLPSIALVDGGHGLGHPVGVFATDLAIEKCKQTGIGAVAVRNSNHYGAAGYYAKRIVGNGLVGMSFTGTPGPGIVPTFGKKAMLGTNPIAFAAPAKRNPPFILDMATSTVAIGKLSIAQRLGVPIPEGWALDKDGNPVTDSTIAREGRLLTPLGGSREQGSHKGYGLATMVDILCSTLAGALIPGVETHNERELSKGNVGHFFLAIDPKALRDDGEFEDDLDELIDALHATPTNDPDKPVMVAGDPEIIAYEDRVANGIPISDGLFAELKKVAEASNAPFLLDQAQG
ncbi:MAG: Ldh family oxidoreductase [Rhodospirillaceae bacterium]|jgi:LDH2 family malate/lactate/ureidoglycolate dehydrogenase|nr:Ldh family oxidoreductase [Rhodospirillaceae bacterium]MBT4938510.1 Ldh family oxidoreductase [Rhodospirillaceae bacterium]MBT5941529.1 Ldh family oxidoreductase [Rhodospirillaceae bacterium]MBT7268718.1 Ldh family oxidoreductase [Rhodospirillaceae bacterium]